MRAMVASANIDRTGLRYAERSGDACRAHVNKSWLNLFLIDLFGEPCRLSEHGEALTILDPSMAEISSTRVVADKVLRAKMRGCGMRPLMRTTGLSQHTVEKILAGLPVRHTTLERVIVAIDR
jgi:hypothetical protein